MNSDTESIFQLVGFHRIQSQSEATYFLLLLKMWTESKFFIFSEIMNQRSDSENANSGLKSISVNDSKILFLIISFCNQFTILKISLISYEVVWINFMSEAVRETQCANIFLSKLSLWFSISFVLFFFILSTYWYHYNYYFDLSQNHCFTSLDSSLIQIHILFVVWTLLK